MRSPRIAAVLVAAAALVTPLEQPPLRADPSPVLRRLVEDYFEDLLSLDPFRATFIGDHRYDDRWEIEIAPTHRRRSLRLEETALAAAAAIDPARLDEGDRLTLELFIRGRRLAISELAFPGHLMPIDHLQSKPVLLALLGGGASVQPFDSPADYESWLRRLTGWQPWVDQAITNMREGVERGVVLPWPVVQRTLTTLRTQIVDNPHDSDFWRPITRMPAGISETERALLQAAYSEVIQGQIVPGYRRLYDFLRNEYLPAARTSVGISDLPDGEAWYAFLIHARTTTDLTAVEIHEIGKREVKRISAELEHLERQVAGAPTVAPAARVPLLDGYRALEQSVRPRLDTLFGTTPDVELEIRPVEPFRRSSAPGASYMAGLPDGTRPGRFYVNADESVLGEPSEALFLHEAVPGHHFQLSIQRQRDDLPRFRRFSNITAFVEGWALYAESLGRPLGLYTDPRQRIGALRSELFRARRLVVDTGIHALGWSREQAIDYLGSSREVDRYIAWPAQALAYKLGELRISELRAMAERRLGSRFDIRSFHDEILGEGSLPLDLLEARITKWIARNQKAAVGD